MKTIKPADIPHPDFHRLMIGSIGPRPIAFASTVDGAGAVNLSPFSFFNMMGSKPPTVVFATTINRHLQKKHTLLNIEEIPEVVINIVNYAMVEQMSLSSAEFERGVNEFDKAGFTPVASTLVLPPRVAESPVAFECRVKQIIPVGEGAGSSHLIVAEIVLAHVREDILDEHGTIDPAKIDLIGRMGGNWYARASGEALFEVARPQRGIGFDQLPRSVRESRILSGNDLGKLAAIPALPVAEAVLAYRQSGKLTELFDEAQAGCAYLPDLLHSRAKHLLQANQVTEAWLVLLQTSLS